MAQSKNGTPNSLTELMAVLEDARDYSMGLNEEKLTEGLVILITKIEHRSWDLGWKRGFENSGKKWWQAIISGTIVVNKQRLLSDPADIQSSVVFNPKAKKTSRPNGEDIKFLDTI